MTASTAGLDEALNAAEDCSDPTPSPAPASSTSRTLLAFYRLFAATEKVMTAFSQGVNQSSAGTDKVNSIINCPPADRTHRPCGHGPVLADRATECTMGGREVGGLRQYARRAHGAGQSAAP
ncbi:hypothetical protein ACTMU2_12675 [Cupriavidus basilensis]